MISTMQEKTEPKSDLFDRILIFSTYLVAILALLSLVISGVSLYQYFNQFKGQWISPNGSISLWSSYVGIVMPMLQTVVGVATLVIAAWLGRTINRRLDSNRRSDEEAAETRRNRGENNRELIRLSEFMVDGDFYLNVTHPSWQIATNWFHLIGEEADEYRAKLVCEFIELPMNSYSDWLGSVSVSNSKEMHPKGRKYSDYMVLALWTRFWSNIVFLEEEGIVTKEGIERLFAEWYRWWAPFKIEYVEVVQRVMAHRQQPPMKNSSLRRIRRLHEEILGFCPKPLPVDIENRIARITDTTLKYIEKKAHGNLNGPDFPWNFLNRQRVHDGI